MEKDQQVISTEPRRPSSSVDTGLENNRRSTIVVESKWEPGSVLPFKRRASVSALLELSMLATCADLNRFWKRFPWIASVLW